MNQRKSNIQKWGFQTETNLNFRNKSISVFSEHGRGVLLENYHENHKYKTMLSDSGVQRKGVSSQPSSTAAQSGEGAGGTLPWMWCLLRWWIYKCNSVGSCISIKKQISKTLKLSAFEFQVGKDLEARRSQLREVKEFHRNEEARLTQVISLDSEPWTLVGLYAWDSLLIDVIVRCTLNSWRRCGRSKRQRS